MLAKFTFTSLLMIILAFAIVAKLVQATIFESKDWNDKVRAELAKTSVIQPERGNILAANGNILACNLTVYDIMLDLQHAKVRRLSEIPWAAIDSLADSLDLYYPRRADLNSHPDTFKKYSWHTRLRKQFEKAPNQRSACLRLAAKRSLDEYEKVKQFPFFNRFEGNGYRHPLYKNARNIRIYPYGKMAHRSIGRVNERKSGELHGYYGLEKDLDSLLYGKPGRARKAAFTSGISNWIDVPAVRGYDILTTIDIDLQEMLEQELLNVCSEANADWGTAILMEVATGEIKAISNIEHLDDGTYGEALNRAVVAYEPGSVMKPISLMIAFEDGLVKSVNDLVDCSDFQRTSDHHGKGMKNMKQIIEQSSNPGIARVIFRGYANDPSKFYDRLASIGFFDPMHSGIADEERPRVRKLLPKDSRGNNITMTARHLDLARQAYGYNTAIPPLYTLAYYNAIANGGKLVRPHLVRGLRDENGHDSIINAGYIRERICSEATAEKVKQCIHEVVWGKHGTARMVQDDRVEIAGKTGTAWPFVQNKGYDLSSRNYAFAAFFPYDKPRYSCMVLIKSRAGNSANRTSGQVVKRVALKMYSRGMLGNTSNYAEERTSTHPVLAGTTKRNANLPLSKSINHKTLHQIATTKSTDAKLVVPDVKGYDATSAIRILEQAGLNVSIKGSGRVVWQSLQPGVRFRRGDKIAISLKV